MRSVVYSQTGGPDVLRLVSDVPIPEPGPGEVRVQVVRSGVNPTDWKSRQGGGPGQTVDPPQTPNQDGAGIVDAIGTGVREALLGLRVWIWEAAHERRFGTAAEYTVVPERNVVLLPDPASFDLGAGLGVPYITAHRCLTVGEAMPARLGPGALAGRTVLVAGGAGAVGHAAIELSRWSDATVIATVSSTEKAQLAAAAGADHVLNYKQVDVAAEVRKVVPDGVDCIVEVSPAQNAALDAEVLGQSGSVAMYANNGGDEVTLPIRPLMMRNARMQFVLLYNVPYAAKERAIQDVTDAVVDGAVRLGAEHGLPVHHFSLEDAPRAHRAVEDGVVGKVLIDVAP
jgi:NADPH2:quinone reductase